MWTQSKLNIVHRQKTHEYIFSLLLSSESLNLPLAIKNLSNQYDVQDGIKLVVNLRAEDQNAAVYTKELYFMQKK